MQYMHTSKYMHSWDIDHLYVCVCKPGNGDLPKAELLHCQAWFRYPLRHRVWLPLPSRLQHRRSRNSLIPSMPFRSLLDGGPMALHLFGPWVLDGPERLQVMCIAKAKTKLIGGFKMPITIVIIVIKNNVWHLAKLFRLLPIFASSKRLADCTSVAHSEKSGLTYVLGASSRWIFGEAEPALDLGKTVIMHLNAPDPNCYIYEVYNHN